MECKGRHPLEMEFCQNSDIKFQMPVLPVNKDLETHTFVFKEFLIYFISAHLCGMYKGKQIEI